MKKPKVILGIWDGHDAGVALLRGSEILFAINEERLTRRKLEVGFPKLSIHAALKATGLTPDEVDTVAVSTTDFAKTLTRIFPSLKESYYQLRRHKIPPGLFYEQKKCLKYWLTTLAPSSLTQMMSQRVIIPQLRREGFRNPKIEWIAHHDSHAATAIFPSGFEKALILILDGIGDGLSGSIMSFENGRVSPVMNLDGRDSLGIFFEHVTNLLNMRELEDEGKVMALATYASPIPDQDNPMLKVFSFDGLKIKAMHSHRQMYLELKKVFWRYPSEQFAFLAQRTLEVIVLELVKKSLKETGHRNLVYAGGLASNIKINRHIRNLSTLEKLFIFPHMGDGGQALGAAMWANYQESEVASYDMKNVYFGPQFGNEEIETKLKEQNGIRVERIQNPSLVAAELIAKGQTLFWFQNRMEYGPRSLGARSIIAPVHSSEVKDALNLRLKKRVWYQPFCPSMLHSDATHILEDYDGVPNQFMTCAYQVKKEKREMVTGVIGVDGSCRPQILKDNDEGIFVQMLRELKKLTGVGIVLNTSLNIHGEPLVCTPGDVLRTFLKTDIQDLIIGNFHVTKAQ